MEDGGRLRKGCGVRCGTALYLCWCLQFVIKKGNLDISFLKRLPLLLLFVAIDSETKTGFTFHRQQPKLRRNIRNNRFRSLGTGPQLTVIAEIWETHELSPAAAPAACSERFQAQHRETKPKKSLERP